MHGAVGSSGRRGAVVGVSCLVLVLVPVVLAEAALRTIDGRARRLATDPVAKLPGAKRPAAKHPAARLKMRSSATRRAVAGGAMRPRRLTVSRARATSGGPLRPARRDVLHEHIHVRSGDTLERLLARRGLAGEAAQPWLAAAAAVYDLRRLHPRRGVTVRFDRERQRIDSIRYEIDDSTLLVLEREGETVQGRIETLPYVREVRGIAGRIERGLREDATEAGVPPSVAAALGDLFGWDIDVENGLAVGDEFRVIYENIWELGRAEPLAGMVIAAEIVTRGRRYTAVFFEDDDGGAYYRPDGGAISRAFLRYPVQFTEISSEFSPNRFHPLLHRERPHLGVDFAAPQGTPVRAAADGVVDAAGWQGGLGRTVRLLHDGDVQTTYGHLSAIAPAVREGGQVEQGQVIGWVGATGLATGPHLHYEIERGGEHLNPLTVTAVKDPPVPEERRGAFERVTGAVLHELARLPQSDRPVRLVLSANAWRAE